MISSLKIAAVAAIAALASASAYYPPEAVPEVDYKTVVDKYFVGHEKRTCTATGDRCSGADKKEHVEYAPCCHYGDVCIESKDLSWGSFCVPPPKDYITCYAEGARCIGAEGYAPVPYFPCCEGYPKSVEGDWGEFCYVPKEEPKVETHYVYYVPVKEEKKKYGYKYVGSYKEPYAPKETYPDYKPVYKDYYETATVEEYSYPKTVYKEMAKSGKDKKPAVSPEWY